MASRTDKSIAADEMYCPECGSVIAARAELCPECGVRIKEPPTPNAAHSPTEHLPYWHNDNILTRYVKFWGDKRLIYQILDILMFIASAGFFIGWIAMEMIMIHSKKQDWDGASKYYADIEEGELA
jgi:hypothetical protein